MTTQTKTIKLIKFGGEACGACVAMKKAKTLERAGEAFPVLDITELDVNDREGNSPEGSKFAENYALSDEYEVDTLPTLIFEDAESSAELARVEGALSFKDLKEVIAEAIAEQEKLRARQSRKTKAGA